jgi:hypothetical protein
MLIDLLGYPEQVVREGAVKGYAALVELKAEEAVSFIVEILARERGAEIVFLQFPRPPLPCFHGAKETPCQSMS